MIALKRILVPHDFSDTAGAAVTFATGLAKSFGAELVFLYVGDGLGRELQNEIDLGEDGVVRGEASRNLLKVLPPTEQASVHAQFFVRAGGPAAEIVRFAAEHEIDLIVMGTHGRGLVGHMVMGSVAERVVRTAPCPVLTVRNNGQVAEGVTIAAAAAAHATV